MKTKTLEESQQVATHYPKVGVGVMVLKDGKVLLGKRKTVHGDGEYGNTGGHVEPLESLVEAVRRETLEESRDHNYKH